MAVILDSRTKRGVENLLSRSASLWMQVVSLIRGSPYNLPFITYQSGALCRLLFMLLSLVSWTVSPVDMGNICAHDLVIKSTASSYQQMMLLRLFSTCQYKTGTQNLRCTHWWEKSKSPQNIVPATGIFPRLTTCRPFGSKMTMFVQQHLHWKLFRATHTLKVH